MASEIGKRDQNSVPVLMGVTDDANLEIRMLRVNPVTGRLQVSSTGGGGGGFTVLTPTETPDGNRTTFTFASATGQPTFIVSDNAMTQAVTKLGIINWTWNSGALQASMTIPPADDIVAIQ